MLTKACGLKGSFVVAKDFHRIEMQSVPHSNLKRTPFSVSASTLPQLNVAAQTSLADGREVMRMVQHEARVTPVSAISFAVPLHDARPGVPRTALLLSVPAVVAEVLALEGQLRHSLEMEESSSHEVLSQLSFHLCRANQRLPISLEHRIEAGSSQRVSYLLRRWTHDSTLNCCSR